MDGGAEEAGVRRAAGTSAPLARTQGRPREDAATGVTLLPSLRFLPDGLSLAPRAPVSSSAEHLAGSLKGGLCVVAWLGVLARSRAGHTVGEMLARSGGGGLSLSLRGRGDESGHQDHSWLFQLFTPRQRSSD